MNFILRTRVGNENFLNRGIGDSYTVTYNSKKTKEEWLKEVQQYYSEIENADDIKCIVLCNDAHVIYENMHAWIMTESGKTFERIG